MTAREAAERMARGARGGMSAREALAASRPRVVLSPEFERAVEAAAAVCEAESRRISRAAAALSRVAQAWGDEVRREMEALAARLRETR